MHFHQLIRFELNKYLSFRVLRAVFCLLLATAAVLSWFLARPEACEAAVVRVYNDYLADPVAVYSYHEELQASLREQIKSVDQVSLPKTYLPDSPYDDSVILARVFERVDYLQNYTAEVEKNAESAERRAKELQLLGYAEDTFEVANQKRVAERLRGIADNVTEQSGYAYGADRFLGNKAVLFLMAVLAVLSAGFGFLNDKTVGMESVIRVSRFGRSQTVCAKLCALFAVIGVGTAAVSAASWLGTILSCGCSSLLMPIQAFPAYATVSFSCSVWGYLLLTFGLRILAMWFLGALTAAAAVLVPSYAVALPLPAAVSAVLCILYYRHFAGTVPVSRYLNPVALAEAKEFLGFPRNLNFFGAPVNVCPAAILLCVIAAVILSVLTVLCSAGLRPLQGVCSRGPATPAPEPRSQAPENKTAVAFGLKETKFKHYPRGLWAYEARKAGIVWILCILLLCLSVSGLVLSRTAGTMKRYDEALYASYLQKAAQMEPEARQAFLAEEDLRLKTVLGQQKIMTDRMESGQISRQEYTAYLDTYYRAKEEASVFDRVKTNVQYTLTQSKRYGQDILPVYDTGIGKFTEPTPDLLCVAVIVLLCANAYPVEFGSKGTPGFAAILRTTRKGRSRTLRTKLAFFGIIGAIAALCFRGLRLWILTSIYTFPAAGQPLCALPAFAGVNPGLSFGTWLILDPVLNAFGGALSAFTVCALSKICRKIWVSIGVSAVFLGGWEILTASALGQPVLSLFSFFRPAVLVQGRAVHWALALLFSCFGHLLACTVLVLLCTCAEPLRAKLFRPKEAK